MAELVTGSRIGQRLLSGLLWLADGRSGTFTHKRFAPDALAFLLG